MSILSNELNLSSRPWRASTAAILAVFSLALGVVGCGEDDPVDVDKEKPASAPVSEIFSPARGAFLTEGTSEDMNITVEGEVCDPTNDITSVILNGSSMSLTENGECSSFMAELNSTWGLNVLEGLVKNDIGNEVAIVQSYLRSGEYFVPPLPGGSKSRAADVVGIPDAFRARLGQDAIDDGDRSDRDDLVTILNLALSSQMGAMTSFLNSAIPNTIVNTVQPHSHQCLLQTRSNREGIIVATNGSISIGSLQVTQLAASEGLLVIGFRTGAISQPLSVAGYLDNACLGELESSATGSVGLGASTILLTLLVETVGDEIHFDVGNVDVMPGNVNVDINLAGLVGWFDGFLSSALSAIGTVFLNQVESALGDLAENQLRPLIATAVGMNAFDLGDISAPLLGVGIHVETETNLVEVGDGSIDYGVTANAYPSTYVKTPEQLAAGTIIGSSTLPAFDDMVGSFGLALKHDFINQVFWAFWAGGGFDFEEGTDAAINQLNGALPAEGVTVASMEMSLPPVLMPGDTESELKIGTGGITLLANIEQSNPSLFAGQPSITVTVPLTVHLSIFFTIEIGFDQDARRLVFSVVDEADIDVQIVGAIRNDQMIALEMMFAQATEGLAEALIMDVSASLPIPSLGLGGSIPGIPTGLKWVLDDGVLDQASGYVRILGSVGVGE